MSLGKELYQDRFNTFTNRLSLLSEEEVNTPRNSVSMLERAATSIGYHDITMAIISQGADISYVGLHRQGLLHNVVLCGTTKTLKHILELEGAPALIDRQDVIGETALFKASDKANLGMIWLLLSKNANPNLSCFLGRTAVSIACSNLGKKKTTRTQPFIRSKEAFDLLVAKGCDLSGDPNAFLPGSSHPVACVLNRGAEASLTDDATKMKILTEGLLMLEEIAKASPQVFSFQNVHDYKSRLQVFLVFAKKNGMDKKIPTLSTIVRARMPTNHFY